jgi:hypothetical protein
MIQHYTIAGYDRYQPSFTEFVSFIYYDALIGPDTLSLRVPMIIWGILMPILWYSVVYQMRADAKKAKETGK